MTNRDRLEAMSDEELALEIIDVCGGCERCPAKELCMTVNNDCVQTVVHWLNQEKNDA